MLKFIKSSNNIEDISTVVPSIQKVTRAKVAYTQAKQFNNKKDKTKKNINIAL